MPPTLIINEQRVLANIKRMHQKALKSGSELRPHFKTHQSLAIGEIFKNEGINGITVSSVKMARYFADHGWDDITIAFPLFKQQIQVLNEISEKVRLTVLAVDPNKISDFDQLLSRNIQVRIEIDPSYGRSGIPFHRTDKIDALINSIESTENLSFNGFYCHAGNTYKCKGTSEIKFLSDILISDLSQLKKRYNESICFGDTPSCSVLDSFEDIDQISPGNFVFYDWMQVEIGSCKPEDIAISMKCPVVSKYPETRQLLIHGGAVHFSKDHTILANGEKNFGVLKSSNNNSKDFSYLNSLSQEHGLLKCTKVDFDSLEIGDEIEIYPIHSCLTANLMRQYQSESGSMFDHLEGQQN